MDEHDAPPPDDGVEDSGEPPIEALATLVEDVPEGLGARVRGAIQRRLLAADLADLSFNQILQVFMEFVKMIFEGLGIRDSGKGES